MKPKLSLKVGQTTLTKKRAYIRYTPDPNTTAAISLEVGKSFKPSLTALVVNESFKGCGLILPSTDVLQVGDVCMIQVGKIAPLKAEVKWRTQIDPQAIKVGVMFID